MQTQPLLNLKSVHKMYLSTSERGQTSHPHLEGHPRKYLKAETTSVNNLTSGFITLQEYTQLLWARKCIKYSVVWLTQALKSGGPARKIYPVAMKLVATN